MKDWGWDERELVRRCKEGSEAAYAELVRQHRPRLFTLAYRLTNDRHAAEDVVQEAFLAAFRQIERFEPKPSLAAWLNTITIRIAAKAGVRNVARSATSFDRLMGNGDASIDLAEFGPADSSQDPHAAAEAAELRLALTSAITALPFKHRAAVVLRYVMGLDYAEAAREMDVPLNTYKSHLLRGTKQLREALQVGAGSANGPLKVERAPIPVAKVERATLVERQVAHVARNGATVIEQTAAVSDEAVPH